MKENMPGGRQPRVNARACIGCMACASVCPDGLISLSDVGAQRTIRFGFRFGNPCGSRECTRCIEACPEAVLSLSEVIQESNEAPLDVVLEMAYCEKCGVPFTPKRLLDNILNRLPSFLKAGGAEPAWLRLCPSCRRYEEALGGAPSLPMRRHSARNLA